MGYAPFQEIHYSHHLFLALSKRGLYSIIILATTHSYSHSFPFPLSLTIPWPYHISSQALEEDRQKAQKWSESAVSEQHRSISQRWSGYSPHSQVWMSLRPPNNRLVGKLSQTPETESMGKAIQQTKHLGKNTYSAASCQCRNATKHTGYCSQSHF